MSTLLRLVHSQASKSRVSFLKSRDVKIFNTAYRSDSSKVQKSDQVPVYEVKQSWISYGFNYNDKKMDRHFMHHTFFITISICLVFGSLIVGYAPDPLLKDWALREAYLQLRYREENGLPHIDPNLIDPSKFTLPSDEELGDTEIII
ncbi:NADH dehydrogenase [ubiquinone] 1 beta subcomplex subunit 11, mitochondrial [Habropoda laboriosa]|uniref:NADH dehydrogenase [ubiquinone] 1 beta subcomplex subunit 11, mitochondrial n=1 Tax=Habropoda laboriosa TaxID=597456 RepID=A0A0L7QXD1_9HYME|nr:PREDICTED: NADH dehydrogenase [ubiquinone] 1 beta subcomplex subunit 11, mitochondrial [Habropoda laboriosa]KOC63265.1 NADH dehydrogenase [ubiquinone] 1 beta subcomplex subunit 11, mitochondrial [Habropoda laboriosa]